MHNKFSPSTLISTFFGIGYIPFAPGTIGSIVAFPLYILMVFLVSTAKGGISTISAFDLINGLLVMIVGLFFIGAWAADQYSKKTGKEDPKEVIIDEIVAQLLTICLITYLLSFMDYESILKVKKYGIDEKLLVLINYISGFILFRLFDITKPWPIDYIDKNYKNGLGIMFDDVIAALFAVVTNFFILYAVIDRINPA